MFLSFIFRLIFAISIAHFKETESCAHNQQNTIYSDDPRISYVGRFASNGTGSSSFQEFGWPGAQISVHFKGSWIKAKLKASSGSIVSGRGDAFLVIVESYSMNRQITTTTSRIEIKSSTWQEYTLAVGLSAYQENILTLWKVTEEAALFTTILPSLSPSAGFSYFTTDGEFSSSTPPSFRRRRLEFIGDSDTAGFCADGKPDDLDPRMRSTENTFSTWAVQLAKFFDADPMIEAISGYTVMGKTGMINFWRRTLPAIASSEDNPEWDFNLWAPDAVILLIGPNDHASNTREFIDAYKGLMEDIVDAYSAPSLQSLKQTSSPLIPKIIHVCGGSINGFDPCESIQTANDEFNQNRKDGFEGFYTAMTKQTWEKVNNGTDYLGCYKHYNREGHSQLAQEIRTDIGSIMGW